MKLRVIKLTEEWKKEYSDADMAYQKACGEKRKAFERKAELLRTLAIDGFFDSSGDYLLVRDLNDDVSLIDTRGRHL